MGFKVANPRGIPNDSPIITFSPPDKDGRHHRAVSWYEGEDFTRPTDPKGFTASMEKGWIDGGFLVESGSGSGGSSGPASS